MDFINKLTHRDDEEKPSGTPHDQQQQQQQQPHGTAAALAQEPEPKRNFLEHLIAGSSGHHHHHGDSAGLGDDDERLSFFDKLTRKEDREKKMLELVKREAEVKFELERIAREKKENEGFLERIKDHFDGDDDADDDNKKKEEESEQVAAAAPESSGKHKDETKPGFFDKFTHKEERAQKAAELNAKETQLRAELAQIEQDKHENAGMLERIKQHLDQDEAEGKSKKAQEEDPSFFDKITGRAAEAERRRKEEESKSTFEKMKDRLNDGMGGGQKAEEKEDMLDKTIDRFQEHVLRKGDQSNESALEQFKDEQIADAIRSQLHIKQKKDDE